MTYKVALVHDSLVQVGGAEKVLKVLADMFPDAPIYTSVYNKEKFQSIFPHSRIRTSSLQEKPNWIKKRYKWLLPLLPSAYPILNADLQLLIFLFLENIVIFQLVCN